MEKFAVQAKKTHSFFAISKRDLHCEIYRLQFYRRLDIELILITF